MAAGKGPRSRLPPGRDTTGKAGKWPSLSACLGNSTNVETVSLPSFDAMSLMGKILLRAVLPTLWLHEQNFTPI